MTTTEMHYKMAYLNQMAENYKAKWDQESKEAGDPDLRQTYYDIYDHYLKSVQKFELVIWQLEKAEQLQQDLTLEQLAPGSPELENE